MPDASLVPDSLAPTLGVAGNPNFFCFCFCFTTQGPRRISGLRFLFLFLFFVFLPRARDTSRAFFFFFFFFLILFFYFFFDFLLPYLCSQRSQASFSSFFDFFFTSQGLRCVMCLGPLF